MLILAVHGSRDEGWRASVKKVVEALQADVGPDRVQLAYMDCAPPSIEDVVSAAVHAGVDSLRVLPLFIADEGHVNRDIRPVVEGLRETYTSVRVEMLPAVGQHPLFRELLATIVAEEGKEEP
jgi:sirohydrochlorin cobaltochelatase